MSDIEIRDLRKSYGKTETIHGLDLDIQEGEFVVILGPSGCGKSTLLRMIAGLEEITAGSIAINGQVVNEIEPRARGCAMVFQNYALYPHMTVAENIGYSLKVAGLPKAERIARIAKVAKALEIDGLLDRKPAQLSGGQRQRVAMGRAMIKEPKVFLFDEPLSNLDARLRVQMRAEIRRLHKRLGATSIFVTHDQVEAMTLADRLVVMNQGRIEQVGSPTEVYACPASRFVASFIGAPPMNLLEGRIDEDGSFLFGEGRRIAVPAGFEPATSKPAAILGIRPEAVRLTGKDALGSLPATVDFVEELGAGRILQLDLDGVPFSVAVTEGGKFEPGATVGISVPSHAIHLFAADTGLRIDQARPAPQPLLEKSLAAAAL